MQKFELLLKNEKQKLYDRFAIFIFILNSIGICIVLLYSQKKFIHTNSRAFLIGFAVALFAYQFLLLFTKSVTRYLNSFLIATLAISVYWALTGYWWVGLFTFCLILLYVISKRVLKVEVDNKRICYPSFPSKTIKWSELNNLVLKDGLLTIDFRNNKIIQQLIDELHTVNEKEFNEFCRQQLNR